VAGGVFLATRDGIWDGVITPGAPWAFTAMRIGGRPHRVELTLLLSTLDDRCGDLFGLSERVTVGSPLGSAWSHT
jgi:hypothetical protein